MSAQGIQYRLLGPQGSEAILSFRRGDMPDLVKVSLKRAKMAHVGKLPRSSHACSEDSSRSDDSKMNVEASRSPGSPLISSPAITGRTSDNAVSHYFPDQSSIKELSISLSPRSLPGSHMQRSPRPSVGAGDSNESYPSPRASRVRQ